MTQEVVNTSVAEDGQEPSGLNQEVLANGVDAAAMTDTVTPDGVADAAEAFLTPPEAVDNLDAEQKTKAEAKTKHKEVEDLPWDTDRQKRDQANAVDRGQIKRLAEQVAKLTERLNAPKSVEGDIDEAVDALEALKLPGDFADDDERDAYEAEHKKRTDKIRALRKQATTDAKKPADPKPKEPDEPKESKVPDKTDFVAYCEEAEAEYGSKFRKMARIACRDEFKSLGYGPDRAPSKEVLRKIVLRVYRETVAKATKPQAEVAQQQPSGGEPRRADANGPVVRLATVEDVAADIRRRRK